MDKLRTSIEEASKAVDREREKNVSLLHLIFPKDIAKRLWLGKSTSTFQDLKSPVRQSVIMMWIFETGKWRSKSHLSQFCESSCIFLP